SCFYKIARRQCRLAFCTGAKLANWWRVLQTALRPKSVQTTLNLEWAVLADVTLEDFAVIANILDDVVGPVVSKTEVCTDFGVSFSAEEAADIRVGRVLELINICLS